jgi:GT2 family glycosyltransferase
MIDLSIIVVSWNTRDVLMDCLLSIEREVILRDDDGRIEVETLLVDNGSCDGTVEAVRKRFPFVDVIALPENRGYAGGNNEGLRRARGRYLGLLNSDTIMKRDALERCVRYLDEHVDVGVVGPQLLNPDGSKQNCIHNYPRLLTEIVPKILLETLLPERFPSKRFEHPHPLDVEAVLGACLLVRREVLDKVGLLPEDYFLFLEETEWCLQIRRAGWRVVHLPKARVVHLYGASSKKRLPAETRIEYHRSLYHFFNKNRGPSVAATVFCMRTLKSVLYVVAEAPLAVSPGGRGRWWDRARVAAWHLRGCPTDWGLAHARPTEGVG